jgi:hypothetical protein
MIVLYPVVFVAALVIAGRRARMPRGGWHWFGNWAVAGALLTFSFLTGFSIGLVVLPVAAAVLLWVASRTPGATDAAGFFAGMGLLLSTVGVVSPETGAGWVLVGAALAVLAVVAYATVPDQTRLGR